MTRIQTANHESLLLVGLGVWGTERWFPVCSRAAREMGIDLLVADIADEPPSRFRDANPPMSTAAYAYIQWPPLAPPKNVTACVIAVPALAHAVVIKEAVEKCPALRWVICEKPCGDSREDFRKAVKICRKAGIKLVMADHYLLKPDIRHIALRQDSLIPSSGGTLRGWICEQPTSSGPYQDAHKDLLVHLLDILGVCAPTWELHIRTSTLRYGNDTYNHRIAHAEIEGLLRNSGKTTRYRFEVSKQAKETRKGLLVEGEHENFELDLTGDWSYDSLLMSMLAGKSEASDTHGMGGVSSEVTEGVWRHIQLIETLNAERRMSDGYGSSGEKCY